MVALQALVVIGRSFDASNKQLYYTCKRLVGKTFLAHAMDLSTSISPNGSRFWIGYREIRNVDLCFFRSFGVGGYEQIIKRVGLMKHLEETGMHVINPTVALLKVHDKYSILTLLAKAGLPVPETFVTESAHWAYRMTRGLKKTVCKPITGGLGFGVMKFEDPDLAFNAYKKLEAMGLPLYIQEYLENPRRDIRAFVVGDRVVASIYRVALKESWKTNIALGSNPKSLKLPKELKEMTVKATKTLGLVYAGVDILETEKGPVLLEVNGSPSWQGLEEASGVNVAEVLVKHVLNMTRR